MSSTIRQKTPDPITTHTLTNVELTPETASVPAIRYVESDGETLVGVLNGGIHLSRNMGGTWTQVNSIPEVIAGVWELPNGEVALTTYVGGGRGGVWVSSGWSDKSDHDTATFTKTLTYSQASNRATDSWGLSFAPKGHVREGLVVVTEYGTQSTTATPDEEGAVRSWLSFDYGHTWKEIMNLFEFAGTKVNLHNHAIAYDPYDDRIVLTFGDGNGSGAKSGIVKCDDFMTETPTWQYLYGPTTNANFQATSVYAMKNCLVFGGDGIPCGIYRIGRRGYRDLSPNIRVAVHYGSGTDTGFIGQGTYQQSPDQPALFGVQWAKTGTESTRLCCTVDGTNFFELWSSPPETGGSSVKGYGPLKNGKVVFTVLLPSGRFRGIGDLTLV